MVQAVLFDVDGVLVHPWRFRSTLARDHGITPDMTASFFNGPFIRCVEGQADVLEVLPPFLASWGWPGSAAEFVARWLSVENAPDEAVLGVVADIRRCGVPCFVASTQERRRARYLAVEFLQGRRLSPRTFRDGAAFYRRCACQRGGRPGGGLVGRAVQESRWPPSRCGPIHRACSRR